MGKYMCLKNYEEFGIGSIGTGKIKVRKICKVKIVRELGWYIKVFKLYPIGLGS